MRQPLLLEAILGNTQKEHPSFSASRSALGKVRCHRGLRARAASRVPCIRPPRTVSSAQVKQVVAQIDESKEVHESRLRLVQLQQRLRGDFEDLVVPARKLLREASVQEVPIRGLTFAHHPSHSYCPLAE